MRFVDANILNSYADGLVFVIRAGLTSRQIGPRTPHLTALAAACGVGEYFPWKNFAEAMSKVPLRIYYGPHDDETAEREYIRQFLLAEDRELGEQFGVEYAEAFHYIGPEDSRVAREEASGM